MNARELADRIDDILDEADSSEEAIYALAMVQYTIWASTHALTCQRMKETLEKAQAGGN